MKDFYSQHFHIANFYTVALSILVLLASGIVFPSGLAAQANPDVKGKAAILVDAQSGQMLWSRNPTQRLPMASTTKVMTTLLALELGDLDDIVTAPDNVEKIPTSSLHLKPGEKLALRDMLYATMVRSANDAAVAVAVHIGGTEEKFLELMNERARQLGMKDTQFKNPNGLHLEGHYSTAYDLTLLAREALAHPKFNKIITTRSIVLDRPDSPDKTMINRARFLQDYPGADGIKSGYTRQAGRCYMGSATLNDWRLISVVLNSPDPGADTRTLMDYGYNNFHKVIVAAKDSEYTRIKMPGGMPNELSVVLGSDLIVCLPKNSVPERPLLEIGYVPIPTNRGDKIGDLVGTFNGKPVARVALVAGEDVVEAPRQRLTSLLMLATMPLAYFVVRRSSTGR